MVQHALDRSYEVVGVCREQSVSKLAGFRDRISIVPGPTDDRDVIKRAVSGCDGVLTILVPWGMNRYASGTAAAVLELTSTGTRVVFSTGWWPSRDGKDAYPWSARRKILLGRLARLARVVDLDDQLEACRLIYASDKLWTVVRLRKAEVRACPSGASTSATRSSRATAPAGSTSRCSWSRRSTTTNSSTRLQRSSAAKHPQRSPTLRID